MAQVPDGKPTKFPQNRSIVPCEDPDPNIDLNNIQGDIYPTFPKKVEQFIFFSITNPDAFRKKLGEFREHITTAACVIKQLEEIEECRRRNKGLPKPLPKDRLHKLIQYQIGFSHTGMEALEIGSPGDQLLMNGQKQEALDLGDEPAPESTSQNFVGKYWTKDWREKKIDGVILAASESDDTCNEACTNAVGIFGDSINIEFKEEGKVRDEEGHEHFGWVDGISQPSLKGLMDPHKGQLECEPGVVIMGLKGDEIRPKVVKGQPWEPIRRPDWAVGGSIMAFRKLQQRVPEFHKFLHDNPIKKPGLNPEQGAALRGARMFGRWQSGVPMDLSPDKDELYYSGVETNNDFRYHIPEPGQARCPFSAHIRKVAPREHFDEPGSVHMVGPVLPHALIMRAGIPYGDKVSDTEVQTQTTSEDRGLLFVSYQSVLNQGFSFIQKRWSNNTNFPPPEANSFDIGVPPGFDPIIGNVTGPDIRIRTRVTTGMDATFMDQELVMPSDFVIAEGGEYFLIPSMKAIDMISRGEPLPGVPV